MPTATPSRTNSTTPSRWRLQVPEGCHELRFHYSIYARDISVRGNYLDHERGFLNPCAACIAIEGYEQLPHRLVLALDGHRAGWQIMGAQTGADGAYWFNNYDHLIHALMFAAELTVAAPSPLAASPPRHRH